MDNMPTSIAIPDQRRRQANQQEGSSPSSYSSSPSTPGHSPKASPRAAQKQKALHARRPSLLSSAFTKQECTTVRIGGEDHEGPMRLVTYLERGQGFVWNPEIFLPSMSDFEYTPLDQRRDPIVEIHISDEEIKKMLPQ
ncbi:hypothetical protein QBC40DRAFT_301784 [Triangularia verruculosa]|uniref:Uncharacterized protein n=1 Tax=Triangularia verruculosa TaxID=2587418 RepID=A0AAN6XBK4_9PEZI|nr:hypothetical protein QBC40DRAFT_301784 [Triangularia verruculosa]